MDDDILFLEETKKVLEEADYEVAICERPTESLLAMRKYEPDCLILDLKMPLLDGRTFLPWVRRQFPDLAVVVCTGLTDFKKHELFRLGVRYFIQKPFTAEFLLSIIDCAITEQTSLQDRKAA